MEILRESTGLVAQDVSGIIDSCRILSLFESGMPYREPGPLKSLAEAARLRQRIDAPAARSQRSTAPASGICICHGLNPSRSEYLHSAAAEAGHVWGARRVCLNPSPTPSAAQVLRGVQDLRIDIGEEDKELRGLPTKDGDAAE
eukprot:g6761.t1